MNLLYREGFISGDRLCKNVSMPEYKVLPGQIRGGGTQEAVLIMMFVVLKSDHPVSANGFDL